MELAAALTAMKPLLQDTLATYSGMVAYQQGTLRAFDGVNSIKIKVPDLPEPWCVDGPKLATVAKLGSTLKLTDKSLVVSEGKTRFMLHNHDIDLVPDLDHDAAAVDISDDAWKVLKQACIFRSPHAVYPWAACIYVRDRKAYVTNNMAAVVFDIDLAVEGMIPAIAVESLASAQRMHIDANCIVFTCDSLSLRAQLPEVEPPDIFFSACDKIGYAEKPLSAGLLEAFESTIMIDPRNVTIKPDQVVAFNQKGDVVEVDIMTNANSKEDGIYDPRFVVPALKVATHVDWDVYPSPVLFRGPGVKGMLAGRRHYDEVDKVDQPRSP